MFLEILREVFRDTQRCSQRYLEVSLREIRDIPQRLEMSLRVESSLRESEMSLRVYLLEVRDVSQSQRSLLELEISSRDIEKPLRVKDISQRGRDISQSQRYLLESQRHLLELQVSLRELEKSLRVRDVSQSQIPRGSRDVSQRSLRDCIETAQSRVEQGRVRCGQLAMHERLLPLVPAALQELWDRQKCPLDGRESSTTDQGVELLRPSNVASGSSLAASERAGNIASSTGGTQHTSTKKVML